LDEGIKAKVVQWLQQQPSQLFAGENHRLMHQWDDHQLMGTIFNGLYSFG
jgi:hypothetical protein